MAEANHGRPTPNHGGQERLGLALRAVVQNAIQLANERGSDAVESEHILLAITDETDSPAARVLAGVGLDHDGVVAALDAERAASLAVVGIAEVPKLKATLRPPRGRPAWGASIREAFRRTSAGGPGHGRRGQSPELDVLAGILLADVGTVPRMLALAGIDQDALLGRVQRERRVQR